MSIRRAVSAVLFIACVLDAPLAAKERNVVKATPKIFRDVVDCRKIGIESERLACYDRNVAALEVAEQNKQVYVADKEEVKKSRRGLFGFSIRDLGLFGGDDSDDVKIDSIEATIRSVREVDGKFMFTLDDGAAWAQTEVGYIGLTPKPGQKIVIKRAAMGSYIGKVEDARAFRMKRINN
jgi:hypothetical protein